MYALRFIPLYVWWHYTRAFADMFGIAKNVFWLLWHFFSVPDTLKTFFQPWERMNEGYRKGFDITATLETFTVNTLMRGVGMLMRTILLLCAAVGFAVTAVVVVVAFTVWVVLPFAVVTFLIIGVRLIFNI